MVRQRKLLLERKALKDIGSSKMLKYASDYGKVVDELIQCYKYLAGDVIRQINEKGD